MSKTLSCEERVDSHLRGRIEDLTKLWGAYTRGEESDPDLGDFHEYGLSFDYCPRGTFNDQKEGFFRYQLSTGGPGDEFRFFTDMELNISRIEYWFLDWFDGAHRVLDGHDYELLEEIYNDFKEVGTCAHLVQESRQ